MKAGWTSCPFIWRASGVPRGLSHEYKRVGSGCRNGDTIVSQEPQLENRLVQHDGAGGGDHPFGHDGFLLAVVLAVDGDGRELG